MMNNDDFMAALSQVINSECNRTQKSNAALKANVDADRFKCLSAANAALRIIGKLEPQLQYGGGKLSVQVRGEFPTSTGDVRDVLCSRNEWEIAISFRNDQITLNSIDLSSTIDFGKEWFGIPCSQTYFETIVPIFNELKEMRDEAVRNHASLPLWNDLPNKAERYYIPILKAFLVELRRLVANNPDVPGRLIHYMLGRYDFYKVITDDSHETTRVEAINIAGTLNRPANGRHSIVNVPRLKLPTRFYHLDFVPGFDNKIEVVCDEGWALTMRIHNASSRIEPSLKFDVQLVSLPSSIHVQVEPW